VLTVVIVPPVAAIYAGAAGVVIELLELEADPVPTLFVAVTVNVYEVSAVNPVTVIVPEPA